MIFTPAHFFALLTNCTSLALLACSAWLITKSATHPHITELSLAIVGVRFFGFSKAIFRYAERMNSHKITFDKLAQIRIHILAVLSSKQTSLLAQNPSAKMLGRFLKDVDSVGDRFLRSSFPIANAATGCAVVWPILVHWNLTAGLYMIILHACFGWVVPFFIAMLRLKDSHAQQKNDEALRVLFGNHALLRTDHVASGTAEFAIAEFTNRVEVNSRMRLLASNLASIQNLVSSFAPFLAAALAIFCLHKPVMSYSISAPSAAAFIFLSMGMFELTSQMGLAFEAFLSTNLAHTRVRSLLESHEPSVGVSTSVDRNMLDAIDAKDLHHQFASAATPTFSGLSVKCGLNQTTLVSGHSGCGKSTFISILIGSIKAQRGSVHIASHAIAAARHRDHIFAATLKENLSIGAPNASSHVLLEALRAANLEEWYKTTPKGLETMLGDGGFSVSGGERQRILIARALLTQPDILCLDECTSHLPENHEINILNAIRTFQNPKSLVVAVHRDSIPVGLNGSKNTGIYFSTL